jgi:hypothetical protein
MILAVAVSGGIRNPENAYRPERMEGVLGNDDPAIM